MNQELRKLMYYSEEVLMNNEKKKYILYLNYYLEQVCV